MRTSLAGGLKPNKEDCRARPEHLEDIPKIMDLLRALNDPLANIGRLVGAISVLAARCIFRAQASSPKLEIKSIDHALTLIGNKGLESELLQLLEDLTILKAEQDE
ncbi:MAG TPA: hypothetical protein VIM73_07370 [Polyangiaceae bacterium]